MLIRLPTLLLVITTNIFSNPTVAQETPVEVVSYYIPGLVNEDKSGSMVDMLDKVIEYSGINFELRLMPTKRVQRDFSQGAILGYFPELDEHSIKSACRTKNILQKKIIVITRNDGPEIANIAQLEGLRVGAVSGYSYGVDIVNNEKISIEYVRSDDTNVKKLISGRLDAIVGDAHSTVNAITQNKVEDQLRYDLSDPISLLDVFFQFQPTDQGNKLCAAVSVALEQLREEGALKTWFDYE